MADAGVPKSSVIHKIHARAKLSRNLALMKIVSWVLRNHIPMILFILVGCRLELKVDRQLDVNLTCVGLLLWWSNLLLLCLSPSRQRVHGLVSFPGHKRAWRHVTCERVQGVQSARRSLLNVSRLMFGSVNMLRGGTPTFFFSAPHRQHYVQRRRTPVLFYGYERGMATWLCIFSVSVCAWPVRSFTPLYETVPNVTLSGKFWF